jgi:hypothetical protein
MKVVFVIIMSLAIQKNFTLLEEPKERQRERERERDPV